MASLDSGGSYSEVAVVDEKDFGYSELTVLDEHHLGVVYESSETCTAKQVFSRLLVDCVIQGWGRYVNFVSNSIRYVVVEV